MSKSYIQTGDCQLWLIEDCGIRVPVLVYPGKHPVTSVALWLVGPSRINMTPVQIEWLTRRLDNMTSRRYSGFWLILATRGAKELKKAPGITPAYYFKWGSLANRQPTKTVSGEEMEMDVNPDSTPGTRSFIRYAAESATMGNLVLAHDMWANFCRCAVNWMIVQGKPLDMFFIVLRGMPFRKNWEQIMAAKFPGYMDLAKLTSEERKARLECSNFKDHLLSPEMAAMHDNDTFDWTVSVELKDKFFTHARRIERLEFNRLGRTRYYDRWRKLASVAFAGALDTLAAFFIQASWPLGDVDRSLPVHRRFLRWFLRPGCVRPAPPPVPPTEYCTDEGSVNRKVQRAGKAHNAPTFDLQEVPDEDLEVDMRAIRGIR